MTRSSEIFNQSFPASIANEDGSNIIALCCPLQWSTARAQTHTYTDFNTHSYTNAPEAYIALIVKQTGTKYRWIHQTAPLYIHYKRVYILRVGCHHHPSERARERERGRKAVAYTSASILQRATSFEKRRDIYKMRKTKRNWERERERESKCRGISEAFCFEGGESGVTSIDVVLASMGKEGGGGK